MVVDAPFGGSNHIGKSPIADFIVYYISTMVIQNMNIDDIQKNDFSLDQGVLRTLTVQYDTFICNTRNTCMGRSH
jgi:hypothetical protein